MARIALDPPRSALYRAARWYSQRTYGAALDPLAAAAHNPRVLWTQVRHETSLARWNRLDRGLKALAVMAAASRIGCTWCVDFGYWEVVHRGLVDPAKLRAVPQWRNSSAFTDGERHVLAYAEAICADPPEVTDTLVATLLDELGEAALVELTAMVAVENSRSRFNSALGLSSQGFRDRCPLPTTTP